MDNNFLAFRNDFVREFELSMSGNKKTDDPLSRKIVSFGNLPKGWDFGAGYPVNNAVISIALTLYNLFKSFGFNELNTDAIPHADSGITLSFSRGDEFFDISIGGNFIIDTTWEKGFGQEYDIIAEHENVKLVDVYKQMIGFLRETSKCNLFGCSTSASITPQKGRFKSDAFAILHNGISVFEAVCACECTKDGICTHISIFYEVPAGSPVVYWVIDDDTWDEICSVDGCRIVNTPSDTGDTCHFDIIGLSNNRAGKILKRKCKAPHVFMCVDNASKCLTPEEYANLEPFMPEEARTASYAQS